MVKKKTTSVVQNHTSLPCQQKNIEIEFSYPKGYVTNERCSDGSRYVLITVRFGICASHPATPSPTTPVGVRRRYRYVLSAFRSPLSLPPDTRFRYTEKKKRRLFLRVRSNVFVSVFYLRTFVFIHFLCVFSFVCLFNLPSHKTVLPAEFRFSRPSHSYNAI